MSKKSVFSTVLLTSTAALSTTNSSAQTAEENSDQGPSFHYSIIPTSQDKGLLIRSSQRPSEIQKIMPGIPVFTVVGTRVPKLQISTRTTTQDQAQALIDLLGPSIDVRVVNLKDMKLSSQDLSTGN